MISVILTILAIESCLSWFLKKERLAAQSEEQSGGDGEEKVAAWHFDPPPLGWLDLPTQLSLSLQEPDPHPRSHTNHEP